MNKRPMYFIIKPLYKFGALSIKWRNKEYPERIVKGRKR